MDKPTGQSRDTIDGGGSDVIAVAELGLSKVDEASDSADLPLRVHRGSVHDAVLNVTHVMYDGYDGDQRNMAEMERVYEVAYRLGKSLGIKSLDRPYSIPYFDGKVLEDSGVSAVWLFPGGHLTIHTFDKKRCVFVDIAMMDHKGDDAVVAIRQSMRVAFGVRRDETFLRGSGQVSDPNVIPTAFGPHLTFHGRLAPGQMNMDWFYDLLEAIPEEIGMTPISEPTVIKPKGFDGRRGLDAVAVIAESHIALHAAPDGRYYFDIFSCKAFDTAAFLQLARSRGLQIDDASITLAARGKDFPRGERLAERRG